MFNEFRTVEISVSQYETLVRESENYKSLLTGIIEAAKLGYNGDLEHDNAIVNTVLRAVNPEYYSEHVEALEEEKAEFMSNLDKVAVNLTKQKTEEGEKE